MDTVSERVKFLAFEPPEYEPYIDVLLDADQAVGIYFQKNGATERSAAGAFTWDRWTCVRGAIHIAETTGAVQLWLDDELVLDTPQSFDTSPPGGIGTVMFGVHWTALGEPDATVYLDNLVVGLSPIECL
jgi:hypothetical protein